MWNAEQYLKFANERSRPFVDLLIQIHRTNASFIIDLGCGPGNLTQMLVERWPAAQVVGVDNSSEMLTQARTLAIPGRLDFVQGDITSWMPAKPVDLIVSNAAFHWIDDHAVLLARLSKLLSPEGTLAVQMPYHFQDPAHLAIDETKADPRWSTSLKGVGLHQQSVMPVAWYVERLHDLGFSVNAWETTYIHVLTGENPVLEWFKGSALRPLLHKLEPHLVEPFLHELAARYKNVYPARNGVTLLPFHRIFFVATRN